MPYIVQEKRRKLDWFLELLGQRLEDDGDYNYAITRLLLSLMEKRGERYANYNSVIGILECAKMEMYRRHTAPYEDKAIVKNGDL